ncbi:MAG: hypothetical protein HN348_27770 [Proteobacteria bacterium]|nr:hypothetical protein [Pseudomonadota bacterium]
MRAKTLGQLAQEAKDFSHSDLGSRVGLDVGDRGVHFSAAYSTEFLSIAGGDAYKSGPRAFMEAHRAELEFFPVSQVQAFLGFGRRIYRELPRTRTELDGGLATMVALKGGWNLTGVAAGRYYRARHIAFDGFGLTGLVRVVVPLPKEAMLKVRPMLVVDHYSKSASFYGSEVPRRDTMGKLRVGLWTPPLAGMRGGVTYSLGGRKSTIANYTYTDHRLLFELRWDGSWDPFAPRVLEPTDHIVLPYGIGTEHESGLDRVQDLLRQEDSARRGSSCVD